MRALIRTPVLCLGLVALVVAACTPAASFAQQADPQTQYDNILNQKYVWQQRLDQARAQIDSSSRALQAAKARLGQTQASLANTQVTVANLQATAPQQIDQLKQDLAGAQDELDGILKENTDRQNKLISDLGANQYLIDQTNAQIQATSEQIDYLQTRIAALHAQIDRITSDIAATQQQLDIFLRFTYKEQRRSILEYLLDSASFGDFIARVDSLQSVVSQENHLLKLSKDEKQLLADTQSQLSDQMTQLQDLQDAQNLQKQTLELQRQQQQDMLDQARVEAQEANDRITGRESEIQAMIDQKQGALDSNVRLLQNLKSAQLQLTSTINNQSSTLQQAQQNEQVARTQLDQLEREAEGIAAIISKAEAGKPAKTYSNGRLAWPLQGAMMQGFGPSPYAFEPPITYQGKRYAHFHTGIDIAAPNGTPIRAAADGMVITTGFSSFGYGNYIIIAHNPTVATLYAHMSRLAVPQGAVVKQGQVIGYEGSTGNSTGPHLHFEVRINGNFVNPLGYL